MSAFGGKADIGRRTVPTSSPLMTHSGHGPIRYPAVQQSLMMQLDVEPTVCDARKMVQ
jgi:hypothetical protein